MTYKFINYPKCSTCKNAKKFLDENQIQYESIHIVENNPSKEELKAYYELSGQPLKKLFNTSGNVYKELNLKDKLVTMTEDEQLELLSSNGMLVKRPLLVGQDRVLIGFKEVDWAAIK